MELHYQEKLEQKLRVLGLSRLQMQVLDDLLDGLLSYPPYVVPDLRLRADCRRFGRVTGLAAQDLEQLHAMLGNPDRLERGEHEQWWRQLVAGWPSDATHANETIDPMQLKPPA